MVTLNLSLNAIAGFPTVDAVGESHSVDAYKMPLVQAALERPLRENKDLGDAFVAIAKSFTGLAEKVNAAVVAQPVDADGVAQPVDATVVAQPGDADGSPRQQEIAVTSRQVLGNVAKFGMALSGGRDRPPGTAERSETAEGRPQSRDGEITPNDDCGALGDRALPSGSSQTMRHYQVLTTVAQPVDAKDADGVAQPVDADSRSRQEEVVSSITDADRSPRQQEVVAKDAAGVAQPVDAKDADVVAQPVDADSRPRQQERVARPPQRTKGDGVEKVSEVAAQVVVEAPIQVEAVQTVEESGRVAAVESVSTVRPTTPTAMVLEAAEAVADALTITPGERKGDGEVVVRLKPDVLDGSAVKITVTGSDVAVSFTPATPEAARILTDHVGELQSRLIEKVPGYTCQIALADVRGEKVVLADVRGDRVDFADARVESVVLPDAQQRVSVAAVRTDPSPEVVSQAVAGAIASAAPVKSPAGIQTKSFNRKRI